MKEATFLYGAVALTIGLGVLFCMATTVRGAKYYVDPARGKDSNPGTLAAPWKTVAKVNSFPFAAGDTIFFKAATRFRATLVPKSGTNNGNLVYGAYGTGALPIFESCVMHNVNHVTIERLQFASSKSIPLDLQRASHNTIENCVIYADIDNTTAWTAVFVRDGSSYNEILNNFIERRNLNSQGNALSLGTDSNNNLIRGNTLGTATHYSLDLIGSYHDRSEAAMHNVVKDNVINNPEGAMAEMIMRADYNLFEGNIISGGKCTKYDANAAIGLAIGGSHNIIRNNILKSNPCRNGCGIAAVSFASGGLTADVVGNRIYNNTISQIGGKPVLLENYGGSTIGDNVFKNNIISNNAAAGRIQVIATASAGSYSFANNLIYHPGAAEVMHIGTSAETVAAANSKRPSSFSGNIQQDPLLNGDYYPLPGSPATSGGTQLTTVTGGRDNTIFVRDAGYFCDGFGIVEGDTIRVGNVEAKITSIDYASNAITLRSPVPWTAGAPVSLPYAGARPDMGAPPPEKVRRPP